MTESLTLIFNRSIITDIFLNEWKCAKVVPVYTQGKRNCVHSLDNYQSISIIPEVVQVFVRIISDQVFLYVTEMKIQTNCQSGFRVLHSSVEWLEVGLDNILIMNVNKRTLLMGAHSSNSRFVRCRMRQWTILGPLLFLININDLPNCLIYSQARMFLMTLI